jgi:hypothetical protein
MRRMVCKCKQHVWAEISANIVYASMLWYRTVTADVLLSQAATAMS